MRRTLRLRSETLVDLTPAELADVMGGVTLTGYYPTLFPLTDCTNTIFTSEA